MLQLLEITIIVFLYVCLIYWGRKKQNED